MAFSFLDLRQKRFRITCCDLQLQSREARVDHRFIECIRCQVAGMVWPRMWLVFPGSILTVRFWVSFMRAALGTGSAPVGLAYEMNQLRSWDGISWYQSENVRTTSSSYWSLCGESGSSMINGPRRPSGYCPLIWL